MIIGDCPYEDCNHDLWIPVADKCPAFQRHECEGCGRVIWTRHSRWDPWSMTEADFLAAYEVDEETHSIREREPREGPLVTFSGAFPVSVKVRDALADPDMLRTIERFLSAELTEKLRAELNAMYGLTDPAAPPPSSLP